MLPLVYSLGLETDCGTLANPHLSKCDSLKTKSSIYYFIYKEKKLSDKSCDKNRTTALLVY